MAGPGDSVYVVFGEFHIVDATQRTLPIRGIEFCRKKWLGKEQSVESGVIVNFVETFGECPR